MFAHDKTIERRWSKHYEVLFVDEISMLSGEMLEALNDTIQQVRRNMAPFGGLQVIFVGDFAQLPPVPEDPSYTTNDFVRPEDWCFPRHAEFWHMPVISTGTGSQQQQQQQQQQRYNRGGRGPNRQPRQEMLFSNRGLALQSDVWWELDLRVIELTKVFRQDDAEFIATLNRMRKGETTPEDLHWLNQQFYYAPLQRALAQQQEEERREQEQLQREVEQLQREEEEEEKQEDYRMEEQYLQMLEDQQQEDGGGGGGGATSSAGAAGGSGAGGGVCGASAGGVGAGCGVGFEDTEPPPTEPAIPDILSINSSGINPLKLPMFHALSR
jgi:hypothetical protein